MNKIETYQMTTSKITSAGTLYILATPIGNLEDITLRALHILKEVECIAAEDTRHTRKLLNHYGIRTPLISYYREKEQQRAQQIVEQLLEGKDIALVSDAGTPAISDPGTVLVQLAHAKNIKVSPIPGPSAMTAAISGSGFGEHGFLFIGFAPAKKGQRRKLLGSLSQLEYPIVFYESPRRVEGFLQDAFDILGNRQTLWARELTKTYEELQRSPLQELLYKANTEKKPGEYVFVIGPAEQSRPEGENLRELLVWYRDKSGLSMKDSCRKLAGDLGLSRSQVYQQALEIWKE